MGPYFNSIKEYHIENKEYCFLMEDSSKYLSTFKVTIPKLMPNVKITDKAKDVTVSYNPDIFVNANECKPTVNSSVVIQNYINVTRKKNTWFNFHATTFPKSTRLLCELPDKNILRIFLTDEEFNTDKVAKGGTYFVKNMTYDILDIIQVGSTIKFHKRGYYDVSKSSYNNDIELYSYAFNTDNTYTVRLVKHEVIESNVIAKYEWGVEVMVSNVKYSIPASDIIGVYKKDYYSYY